MSLKKRQHKIFHICCAVKRRFDIQALFKCYGGTKEHQDGEQRRRRRKSGIDHPAYLVWEMN